MIYDILCRVLWGVLTLVALLFFAIIASYGLFFIGISSISWIKILFGSMLISIAFAAVLMLVLTIEEQR
jgi:hypothetical protein